MQLFTLITADILFLIIIIAGVTLDRRIARLEFERENAARREDSAYSELADELVALKNRVEILGGPDAEYAADERLRGAEAEKRFSEGVSSILGYELRRSPYPVHEPARNVGAEGGAQ